MGLPGVAAGVAGAKKTLLTGTCSSLLLLELRFRGVGGPLVERVRGEG